MTLFNTKQLARCFYVERIEYLVQRHSSAETPVAPTTSIKKISYTVQGWGVLGYYPAPLGRYQVHSTANHPGKTLLATVTLHQLQLQTMIMNHQTICQMLGLYRIRGERSKEMAICLDEHTDQGTNSNESILADVNFDGVNSSRTISTFLHNCTCRLTQKLANILTTFIHNSLIIPGAFGDPAGAAPQRQTQYRQWSP